MAMAMPTTTLTPGVDTTETLFPSNTMATSTISVTDMSSATPMPSSDMSGMGHGGMGDSNMMGMSSMSSMTFYTSTNTALYSGLWTPSNTGQYAGTCIFLILLAVVFRALLAYRASRYPIYAGNWFKRDSQGVLRSLETGEKPKRQPWKTNVALARACVDVAIAGVGYLLMLAVMTMNVGYFMSVLGGVFLGSFVWGGLTGTVAH